MNIRALQEPYKPIFMTSDEIASALEKMEQDESLNTKPSYVKDSSSSIRLMTFGEKHSAYLKDHPKINPEHYLSNLRTMIKIRL